MPNPERCLSFAPESFFCAHQLWQRPGSSSIRDLHGLQTAWEMTAENWGTISWIIIFMSEQTVVWKNSTTGIIKDAGQMVFIFRASEIWIKRRSGKTSCAGMAIRVEQAGQGGGGWWENW